MTQIMPANDKDNVEVKRSQIAGAGRGLFASKDFAPGDVVLSVARPLVAELNIDRTEDSCAWCFQRGAIDPDERKQAAAMGLPIGFIEVKSCTGCRKVSYCSKTCQSKAWKREHKYECKILAVPGRPDLPPGVRAVVKLLGRLKADPSDEQLLDILQFRPFAGGLEALRQQDQKTFDDFEFLASASWNYAGQPKFDNLDSRTVSRAFLFNVLCNNLGLGSPLDDAAFGIGFDPLVCSANHSCEPNVVATFNQPSHVLRAIKPIKQGDEILMKYADVTNPFTVRQAELKQSYYFTCQCPKCKKGAVFAEDSFAKSPDDLSAEYCKQADALIKRHESRLERFMVSTGNSAAQRRAAAIQAEAFSVSENSEASPDEIKNALRLCVNSGMWTWTRQPVPQLCRQLFGAYLTTGDPYCAFRVGLKMHFEIMPQLAPLKFDPDRLINDWTMSTVINVLCGPMNEELYQEMAQSGIELRVVYLGLLLGVHENMPKMYGWDTPFGRVVGNTYEQIMAGVALPEERIREKVEGVWPALETLAHSINVDNL
ncbi:uncharacterized protein BCR38DRAFT_436576 [Pseudomassariella vexata]|uniref:Uncharacterized protein n=1 Tax=Pseudomassariella vexata TaxID=1141098 RepID=A0A1Y2DVQ2_9PEZI|nr:uncharacterized protein BCR38DRAFT_436576 [Pseudomassariella vexata]ORY63337.1 hypothetical protein BCR38DRAFT_436576 [Pseudomassariella vexata]